MKILAFGGYTHAGKSTIANLVLAKHPDLFFKPPHIKQPMVEMAIPLLRRMGVAEHMMTYYLDDPDGKLVEIPGWPGITGKLILQVIGKNFRDGVDPTGELFIILWRVVALDFAGMQNKHAIMESLRFPNEKRVLGPDAITIWVDKPGIEPRGDEFEPRLDTKYTISNDNMPIHMYYQVKTILEKEGLLTDVSSV